MIQVHRGRPPAPLLANQKKWTERFEKVRATDAGRAWATPAARKVLLPPLLKMTTGKCAYCETVLHLKEIDHYYPKRHYPGLVFSWPNLFPACGACNRAKADSNHKGALLKCDMEDPERYFYLSSEGDLVPRPELNATDAARARKTIEICDLNRGELRGERLRVYRLAQLAARDHERSALLRTLADPRSSYRFAFRAALRQTLMG